jgi:hypothetical protein
MSTHGQAGDGARCVRARSTAVRLVIANFLLFATAGCSGLDAVELADFRPLPPDGFEMRTRTTLFYGPGIDTWAEGQRLRWLQGYVRLYAVCPDGYHLTSRDVSFEYQSSLGYPVDEIAYRGHCV